MVVDSKNAANIWALNRSHERISAKKLLSLSNDRDNGEMNGNFLAHCYKAIFRAIFLASDHLPKSQLDTLKNMLNKLFISIIVDVSSKEDNLAKMCHIDEVINFDQNEFPNDIISKVNRLILTSVN